MRKREPKPRRSLNATQALRKPSLHELSDMAPERRNVVVEVSAIPVKDIEAENFAKKLKERLLKATIDSYSSLFPPTFTIGDVLSVGSTFILRALANVSKESRLELLNDVFGNIRGNVQKLDC